MLLRTHARLMVVGLWACLILVLGACGSDEVRPGFCDSAKDCRSDQRCELAAGANFHKCVSVSLAVTDGGPKDTGADRPGTIDNPGPGADAGDARDGGDAAPTPCTGPTDCKDPTRPFCQAGLCTGCQSPDAGTCPAPAVCDPSSGACVECTTAAQCTKPEAPLCTNGTCTSCAGNNAACASRDPAHPVCAASGRCVECSANDQCKTAGKTFCVMEACVGCQQAGATACTGPTPVCNAGSGGCVECVLDTDCKMPAAPFCVANKCTACGMAPAGKCATLNPLVPACGPSGACVECNTSADCGFDPNRPICNTADLTCRGCAADSECVAKSGADPGVCLDHRGGRCATTEETIYVSGATGCNVTGGTKATPLCTAQDALKQVTPTRALVLIRGTVGGFSWPLAGTPPLTIVGQLQAVINGGVGSSIKLDGAGEVLIRNVTVRGSEVWSVIASGGAALHLRNAVVQNNNGGGIYIDGGRFDIRNTVIAGNGPGQAGIAGGMSVQAVTGAPARLENVSIKMNTPVGLTCAAGVTVTATGLFAKGNNGIDVALSCAGVTTCPTEGAACGATP